MAYVTGPAAIKDAVHLCVDMQNIFAPGGIWETPWMARVLPIVEDVARLRPERNVFTRFITPEHPTDRPGRWQRYFTKWECTTRARLDPQQLALLPKLAALAPAGHVIDKPGYSAFAGSPLLAFLRDRHVGTLIVTGSETDVCVLATVLAAVDFGFRVIVVEDAICSSSDEGHDALMTIYRTRYSEQIELIPSADIRLLWQDD